MIAQQSCCSITSDINVYNILLIKHHAMKEYGGMEVWLHSSLTSALDGGEWSTLPLGKEPPVPIGEHAGWVPF
jgi:hypothetical protein